MRARVGHSGYLALARPPAFAGRTSRGKRCSDGREPTDIYHGIGLGPGKGATPQMADAHGGRGVGVGIRKPFPCLDGEQLGSVAGLHVMQTPVKVLMSGYGLVKPSVSVWRKATIWFSSVSLNPSLPNVMSILFGTSGIGQQSTFSVVPAGQCPEVTSKGKTSRVL